MISSRHEFAELLSTVSLSSRCSRRERSTIARHMGSATLPAGTPLIEEGEGDASFLTLDGSASVSKAGREVSTVDAGARFGELALLDGEPRSAMVIAVEPITLAGLGVRMFRTLACEFPEMTTGLFGGLNRDLREARDALDRSASAEPSPP